MCVGNQEAQLEEVASVCTMWAQKCKNHLGNFKAGIQKNNTSFCFSLTNTDNQSSANKNTSGQKPFFLTRELASWLNTAALQTLVTVEGGADSLFVSPTHLIMFLTLFSLTQNTELVKLLLITLSVFLLLCF